MAKDKILNFARIYDKVQALMFYLTLFALTSILFFFAEKSYAKSRIMFYTLSYAAIFLLAFVAGARDETVGTDLLVYGVQTYKTAVAADSFADKATLFGWIDSGYYAIYYVTAKAGGGLGIALFLQSFIMTAFAFHGMKRYMATAPLWLSMLIYELYFYNLTLNLMRQGIAMSIVLWSLRFFETRQIKKLFLCAILCFFFHKTSVLAYAAIFAIYWATGKSERFQKRFLIVVASTGIAAVAFFAAALAYLANASPVFAQFAAYGGEVGTFKSGVSTLDVLFRMSAITAILWMSSTGVLTSRQRYVACMFFIADVAMQFFGLYTYFATRMGYYFFVCEIPLLLSLLAEARIGKRTLAIANTCIMVFFCYYCVRFNFVQGNNETYPYSSETLNITCGQ